MDAELLIMPEINRVEFVAVKKQIDVAIRRAAKRAGLEFRKAITEGIMKGVAAGGGLSITEVFASCGQDAPHLPEISVPVSTPSMHAPLNREPRMLQGAKVQASRTHSDERGGYLGEDIKGASFFRPGVAESLATPSVLTGGSGLWGMMRAGAPHDNISIALEQWFQSHTAQDKVSLASLTGIDLATLISLERLGRDAGMTPKAFAAMVTGIMRGITTKLPLFAGHNGTEAATTIPAAFASLANTDVATCTAALADLGVLNSSAAEFFSRLRLRGGSDGTVTLSDVLARQKVDELEAKSTQDDARTLAMAYAEIANTTAKCVADISGIPGEIHTVSACIEDIARQQKQLITGLARALPEAMQYRDDTAPATESPAMPYWLSALPPSEPRIAPGGDMLDLLTRGISRLTVEEFIRVLPEALAPLLRQWLELSAYSDASKSALPQSDPAGSRWPFTQ